MRRLQIAARLLATFFAGFTALYALVASSAFAYQQFIKPHVFRWIATFANMHAVLAWGWLALVAFCIVPDMGQRGLRRALGAALLVLSTTAVVTNSLRPIVPTLIDGPRSAIFAAMCFVPAMWLAALDHAFAAPKWTAPTGEARTAEESRLLVAAFGAALIVVATHAVLASIGLQSAFEPDLQGTGLPLAIALSLLQHAVVFVAIFLVVSTIGRIAGHWPRVHYAALLSAIAVVVGVAMHTLLADALGLVGVWPMVATAAGGTAIALTWGAIGLRFRAAHESRVSPIDVWLGPSSHERPIAGTVWVALAIALAVAVRVLSNRADWDFVIAKSGVAVVWAVALIAAWRVAGRRRVGTAALAVASAVPLIFHAFAGGLAARHAIERYTVFDPSFRVADGLVRRPPDAPSFDRFLRANTGLTDISVAPVSIDFVPQPMPPAALTPHVFLFVIDSLRTDYLSPYNPAVHFTPRLETFAHSNVLFPNAFTRYGGTGLSMPAMWAGSAIVHKQYVQPFAPMNTLEKAVDINGFVRLFSEDHITQALWQPSATARDLDRGRAEMDFDFCRTLEELTATLRDGAAQTAPVFAQTRSLNLHVAAVRNGYVPLGKTYDGFSAPYAWRVERMDGCFGDFVDTLKSLRLYERSLIVFTADHGELIGEDGRWGHSYYMTPEIVRVPLIVHFPDAVPVAPIDRHALTLSTDITPTIYSVLGYHPRAADDLMGRSVLDDEVIAERRRSVTVLAASYGAVYAVVDRNGRRLYVADAIAGAEHAFERRGADWTETPVDPWRHAMAEQAIRRHVDALSRRYHVERRFTE